MLTRSAYAFAFLCLLGLIASEPALAGRVDQVVPNAVAPGDPGCVVGPISITPALEYWYVEQGKTYTITLADISDCADGGTDSTIMIEVVDSHGQSVFLNAIKLSTGTYQLQFTMPSVACGPYQIRYCVYCTESMTGFVAGRKDGTGGESDLFPATFGPGCTNPVQVTCPTSARPATWGAIKAIYR